MSLLSDIPHSLAEYLRAALSTPYTALPSIPRASNTTMPAIGGSAAVKGAGVVARRLARRAVHLDNLEIVEREIDARSVVTIIVFFVVNILVIFPLRIPLPLMLPRLFHRLFPSAEPVTPAHAPAVGKEEAVGDSTATAPSIDEKGRTDTAVTASKGKESGSAETEDIKRWHFVLGLETAPVIGWLLLLAATCIDGGVVRNGIVGGGGVRPYDIMTLFLSFAYIAISLDRTNLLRYLAYHVATRAASSGRKLYVAFFVFFSCTGLIVGNDPLILSGTPFLAHFSRLAGIENPTAYLFTQFQTANLVSALLVSSNPTNLVLSSGFGLSFLQYSAWLALPTVASIIVLFPLLRWVVFRKPGMIPLDLRPPTADPANALKDPWGAAFGGVVFLITIIVLIALSAVGKLEGVEGVWTVTAPAALLILGRDLAYDIVSKGTREGEVRENSRQAGEEKGGEVESDEKLGKAGGSPEKDQAAEPATAVATPAAKGSPGPSTRAATPSQPINSNAANGNGAETDSASTAMQRTASSRSSSSSPSRSPPTPSGPTDSSSPKPETATGPFRRLRARFPTVTSIVAHLPWTLIPFAFSMFILVESLSHTGWIRVFGGWWASWADVGGVAGGIFLMGLIGALGCNIFGTNIGCVVLLSRVMQQWAVLRPDVSERTFFGSVFALAIGSNFGAYSFVFPASLAGLLWKHLLAQKDMYISRKEFAYWNTVPVIVTMIVGCLVVAGEVCVMLPG